jgi:large subunit ribosomal protein L31
MRKDIHPTYSEVVFWDLSSDYKFLSRSTMVPSETTEFEGKTYPVIKLEVSSQSHPFYTGKKMMLDTAGRVDKFKQRMAKKQEVKK